MAVAPAKLAFVVIFAAYPLLVYLGLTYLGASSVALLLVVAALLRLAIVRPERKQGAATAQLVLALAIAIAIGVLVLVSDSPMYLRYYPVCMNLMLLCLFGYTLLRPPSMIERFARMRHPDLPSRAVHYTRNVTIVWCAFFLLNGAMALYTSTAASLEFWALYNGTIAYVLMALLFAGEYLVRRRKQKAGEI